MADRGPISDRERLRRRIERFLSNRPLEIGNGGLVIRGPLHYSGSAPGSLKDTVDGLTDALIDFYEPTDDERLAAAVRLCPHSARDIERSPGWRCACGISWHFQDNGPTRALRYCPPDEARTREGNDRG